MGYPKGFKRCPKCKRVVKGKPGTRVKCACGTINVVVKEG